MRIVQLIIMLSIIFGGTFYVTARLWQIMPVTIIGRILLVTLVTIAVLSPFISIFLGSSLPQTLTTVLYKIGTSWIMIFIYLLIVFLAIDLVRLTHLFPLDKYLFDNWISFGVLVLLISGIFTAGYVKYKKKDRVELPISTTKTIASPLKIVAISDLHLGFGIGKKEFEKWVDLINAENPDAVLIAGDAIDNNVLPLYKQNMAETFRKIRSKYGTFAIFGNHEYISNAATSSQFLQEAGVTLLRDTAVLVDSSFYIVGRDDRSNQKRLSLNQLVDSLDKTKPIIVLDHQPYHLEEAEQNDIDLQISGHTHYGQIWPLSWITDAIYEVAHGYKQKGNTHIYVTSGIGIWGGKFRIGTRSEYVVITLD